jgi:hypothetical protein
MNVWQSRMSKHVSLDIVLICFDQRNPLRVEPSRIFQTAFGAAEKFFPRWEVEKERLAETLAKLPEAWRNAGQEANGEPEASAKGKMARPRRQKRQKRLLRRKNEPG